jgi:hypothetical protein
MPVETPSLFTQVIQEHLDLKRRNADLNTRMPIDRYRLEDTFSNHPLFKSEEQARLEETMDAVEVATLGPTVLRWPGEESMEQLAPAAAAPDEDSGLWGRSRDFDWGD